MANPSCGAVVPGAGGLRKLRFAPRGSHRGKRGGYRVCYVHYERFVVIALATAYDKADKGDLDPGEITALRTLLRDARDELEQGS